MLAALFPVDVKRLRSDRVPPMEPVIYERRGAAAVVTIDRQERRNAIDGPTAALLADAYERFESDDDARVLVLTGAGGVAFCAGADLKAIETFGPRLDDPRGPLGMTRVVASKPTIAAISGWCLAGGLELALWCDLRIATEQSALGFPERRWGVPLIDGGTQRLPRIVGLGRALDLILSGRIVDAPEALGMGLVTEVVPAGRHLERALEIAEGLARFPQDTMLADRRAAIEGMGLTLEDGLALEAKNGVTTLETAWRGAARFAGGEGRGATGAGV
jgi:enoyl-CoA hydratase